MLNHKFKYASKKAGTHDKDNTSGIPAFIFTKLSTISLRMR